MAEAALAINARCNVTRGRAIIRDQGSKICEGIDKQYFRIFKGRWLVGLGVMAMSLVITPNDWG